VLTYAVSVVSLTASVNSVKKAAAKLMVVTSYILTERLSRVRFHGPFYESAAYLLDSEPDR